MYFEIKPKTRREDLFGVDYALKSLVSYLSDDLVRMVVIKGLRRTGKTSLLNVALNECGLDYTKIDVRESYYSDRQEFFKFIISRIRQSVGESIMDKIIKKISGFGLTYKDVSANIFFSKEENLMLFFDNFNKQLMKKNKKFILAFDEVQLLKGIGFDYCLASIFDNYANIKLLLTGSEVGLLDKFLGKKDYQAPLYGRACLEIELTRIDKEKIMKFLEWGFKQIKKKISIKEISDVIENLDGIIGWVSYYGWFRYKNFSHAKAIEKVREEGEGIVKNELKNFLEGRKVKNRYLKLLRYIGNGNDSWNLLKYSFEKDGITVTDGQLNLYLKELVDYGLIEKRNKKYLISDPIMQRVIK